MGPLGVKVLLFLCIAFPVASTIPRENRRDTQRKDCSGFDPNPSTPQNHEEILSICTQSLQNLEGYLHAIGFHSTKPATPIADENPCGSTSGPGNPNETDWNVLDGSVCVKLLSGLHSFENATELCNNEMHKGLDIAHPSIISSDLFIRYNNYHNIFREQTHVASVWVQRNEYFSTVSTGSNCTEIIVNLENSTTEGFELRDVECERLNSVMCVKPIPVSYAQLVERQLKTKKETENLRAELEAQRVHMEKKSLEKDSTLTLEVAQVEEKLRAEVKLLVHQLQEMQTSQQTDKTQKTKQIEDLERIGKTTTATLAQVDSSVKSIKIWEEKTNTEIQRNLKKAESENQKLREELREEMQSMLDSFRTELVSQMKSKSAVFKTELKEVRREKEELEERVMLLEGKFKALESETSLQVSNQKESCKSLYLSTELQVSGIKRQLENIAVTKQTTLFNLTQIDSDIKTLERRKEETESRLGSFETALRVLRDQVEQLRSSNKESFKVLQETTMKRNDWYLDGPTTFVIQKAMGTWYLVEGFYRTSKYSPDRDCEEYGFSLQKNYGIENKERWRVLSQNKNGTVTRKLQTDNQSPYFWTQTDAYTKMWLKTDYENWGILALCSNKDVSSCNFIFTLSRTRNVPPATLQNLREAVELHGFPKQYGTLLDTSSC